jgi:hypothetical protein
MTRLWALAALALLNPLAVFAQSGPILGGLQLKGLFAPGCEAIAYEASPVYDAPGGLRVGQLVLDHPEYAARTVPHCSFRPQAQFVPEGQQVALDIALMELGAQEPALAVFETRTYRQVLWLRGKSKAGSFWLPAVSGRRYLSYERDLVQGLARFPELCDNLGRCGPTTQAFQKDVQRAGLERLDTCLGHAYEIEGIERLPDGRNAYRVRLAETLAPKFGSRLPLTSLVPTYESNQWTGLFDPAGC